MASLLRRLAPVVPALLAATSIAFAADNMDTDERGVTRAIDVNYETFDGRGFEIDRFRVSTQWNWEVGNRSEIEVVLPWQKLETQRLGVGADADGLMDASLNWTFRVRDLEREGSTSALQLRTNLPVGRDGLNATEFAAVSNTVRANQGFLNPQFGRGFGAGLRNTWTRREGDVDREIFVGFMIQSAYDVSNIPGNQIRTEGFDNFEFGVRRSWIRQDVHWDAAVRALIYGDSANITNGIRRDIDSDPSFKFSLQRDQRLTPVAVLHLDIGYQFRDRQDLLSPGIAVLGAATELGDRLSYQALYRWDTTPDETWEAGIVGLTSFANEVNGNVVANTQFNEAFARLGYSHHTVDGNRLSAYVDIGVTGDSRDALVGVSYSQSF